MDETKVRIKDLDIKYPFRGSRGKKRSKRKKDANKGIHQQLLRPLKPEPILMERSDNMNFGLANVRSIRNKHSELISVLHLEDIDILAVTESWLGETADDEEITNKIKSEGFKIYNAPRKDRDGGGTCIIAKPQIKVDLQESGKWDSFEYSIWKCQIKKGTQISVVIVYRIPRSHVHSVATGVFLEEFPEFMDKLQLTKNDTMLVCGDFNLHVNDPEDLDARAFNEIVSIQNLKQWVTCVTHEAGNTLDLILTLEDERRHIEMSNPCPIWKISDHWIVKANINIEKPKIVKKEITYRKNLERVNKELYRQDIGNMVDESQEIVDADLLEFYNRKMQDIFNEHVPEKTKYLTLKSKPGWITDETRALKSKVRKAEREWRKVRSSKQESIYRELRIAYRKHIKVAKFRYTESKLRDCGKDAKRLYSTVRELTGRVNEELLPEGEDEFVANELLKFFMNKVKNIRKGLEGNNSYIPIRREVETKFSLERVTEESVTKILGLTRATTCYTDPCDSKIVKEFSNELIPIITRIINHSIDSRSFGLSWKTSTVIPLMKKKGTDTSYKNYRPVNTLPFLAKICEKCILSQMNCYLAKNKLIPDFISAYRSSHNTELVVAKLVNDALRNMDEQRVTSVVAIDMSAAFDSVDHSILLDVLPKYYGFTEEATDWFMNYLHDRSIMVKVNKSVSDKMDLPFSVPQGSCGGPALYNLYAGTISEVISEDIGILGYADDNTVYNSFSADNRTEELSSIGEMSKNLKNVGEWMKENKMQMNASKTEYVRLGNIRQIEKCSTNSIEVCGDIVKVQDQMKFLGVDIDGSLDFKKFINRKCRAARANLMRIRELRNSMSQETCQQLVQSLVISHIDYANIVLLKLPKSSLKPMEQILNTAAKIILKKGKRSSSTEAKRNLHWLPVEQRVQFKALTIVHRTIYGEAPQYIKDMFSIKRNTRSLRSDQYITMEVPKAKRVTYGYRALSVAGPMMWNNLPGTLRNTEDYQQFKTGLKTELFKIAYNL